MNTTIVILAAGQGKRMKSKRIKVIMITGYATIELASGGYLKSYTIGVTDAAGGVLLH